MSRGIKIILTILLISIFGALVTYIYLKNNHDLSTPDESLSVESSEETISTVGQIDTSNWKTYRNEEYGFEFKYPPFLQEPETSADSSHIVSLVHCDDMIHGVTVSRCGENEYIITVYISDWAFNAQNVLKAFDSPPSNKSSLSPLPFGMIDIGGRQVHIGINSVWNKEEWLVQMALNNRTLTFRFQGDGFIDMEDKKSSLEGLQKINNILVSLRFQ